MAEKPTPELPMPRWLSPVTLSNVAPQHPFRFPVYPWVGVSASQLFTMPADPHALRARAQKSPRLWGLDDRVV